MNLAKLRESRQGIWLIIDLAMMVLLIANLLLLIFDALYTTDIIYQFLDSNSHSVVQFYEPLHQNFLFIDLGFIAIFLSEFMLRWAVAVKNKEYMRWYFFPFIHWYDLVGCIPAESARIFRLLRVISILYRLHKYQVIDFKKWPIFRFLMFYYNVFVEELSDRIVVKVLSDAQEDIAKGSHLLDNIQKEVLKPRKDLINQWIATTAQHFGDTIQDDNTGVVIRQHIVKSVAKAVRDDPQIGLLNRVPVLGGNLEKRLESTVSNVVIQSLTNMLRDLDKETLDHLIDKGVNQFSQAEHELNQQILLVINEIIDLVKDHVADKRWQEKLAKQEHLKGRK